VFYLDIAYVLQWLFKHFLGVFADACFICLETYVANVSSGCFKSRICIAHVAMMPVAGGQRPTAGL
jgi:hypothetical protein